MIFKLATDMERLHRREEECFGISPLVVQNRLLNFLRSSRNASNAPVAGANGNFAEGVSDVDDE